MTPFESAPTVPFHRRLVIAGGSGQFSDGFSLGIIGIALSIAKEPLGLTEWWLGALGAASLLGLFFGSLAAGSIADRFGRRPIFAWGMLLFTVLGILQYFSTSVYQLFVLRFLLGVALGADYVSCKAMITEYSPSRNRGQMLSILALSWTSGYFSAFAAGYIVRESGSDAWRIALLVSAIPSFIAFLLRVTTPESPFWLVRNGKTDQARAVVTKYVGSEIALPAIYRAEGTEAGEGKGLFKFPLLKNLIVGGVFHTSQVIPLFALGTFLPIVMAKAGAGDGYTGALVYNLLFLIGALIGPFVIDRIPRRRLLVDGFIIMAILLAILITWQTAPTLVTMSLFAVFAFVLSVAGILQFV